MKMSNRQSRFWLFGYGSLIFKTDFPYLDRRPAMIDGWVRRFWQGSHDHRGTESAPGRVVTLLHRAGARCKGMAYLIEAQTFGYLDHREKNGYRQVTTELTFTDGSRAPGCVYIATENNPAYLGPASEMAIARQIAGASGPSGHNRDYLVRLADALRDLAEEDPHTFAIERHLVGLDRT